MSELIVRYLDNGYAIVGEEPIGELVRCKECRYWTKDNGMQFDNNVVVAPCKQWLQYTRMDGYCHHGEREGER